MEKSYDCAWDLTPDNPDYSERCEEAFDKKAKEWKKRKWMSWLDGQLTFPFPATREESLDDWEDECNEGFFLVGDQVEVLGWADEEMEDELIMVEVRQEKKLGIVNLCDLEVTPKTNPNYWPVREYVVWFANH